MWLDFKWLWNQLKHYYVQQAERIFIKLGCCHVFRYVYIYFSVWIASPFYRRHSNEAVSLFGSTARCWIRNSGRYMEHCLHGITHTNNFTLHISFSVFFFFFLTLTLSWSFLFIYLFFFYLHYFARRRLSSWQQETTYLSRTRVMTIQETRTISPI